MRVTAFVLFLALALIHTECAQHGQQVDCSKFKKLPPGKERPCYEIYQPICGSDGKTYANDCFFCSEVEKTGNKLKFVHRGQC
ncbi:serine protease inhibitor Kazal-type 9 [Molossus nigricans]|uniref:Serine peptidase inhibitor Kazal type 9 n=1 Tax=Molossus molossus TaxID=27622 RepID=A0A7J8ID15_MOLMO|nr:serine protease inhibitor Kazal-type 9 [Molossus molossus]KAF6482221.1 serine peptidase inhibitor Kazal type 9 [Molossus molossus]